MQSALTDNSHKILFPVSSKRSVSQVLLWDKEIALLETNVILNISLMRLVLLSNLLEKQDSDFFHCECFYILFIKFA